MIVLRKNIDTQPNVASRGLTFSSYFKLSIVREITLVNLQLERWQRLVVEAAKINVTILVKPVTT